MNKLLYLLIVSLSLSLMFCSKLNETPVPPCAGRVAAEIQLPLGFLGDCASGSEGGSSKEMRVRITVDGVEVNSTGASITLLQTTSFDNTNANNGGTAPENVFSILIPSCGTYVITVEVRGKDDTCFSCCNGASVFNPNCGSSPSTKGVPNFRGVSISINATEKDPPPATIVIPVSQTICTDCGC